MWMIKEVFFQETVCKWKSFQEDNEGFVNGPEKPPIRWNITGINKDRREGLSHFSRKVVG